MNGVILDTNVVSEPRAISPSPHVTAWFGRQDPDRLFLTAMVVAELSAGIERLSLGRKRDDIEAWRDQLIRHQFRGRILVMDTEAALIYGKFVAVAFSRGKPPSISDAQIAAVAKANDMAVATRNTADFEVFDIQVIDPWAG